MKLIILLALVAAAAAAAATPKMNIGLEDTMTEIESQVSTAGATEPRNQILINILVNQLFAFIRRIINNGSIIFGLPPMDPLVMDNVSINIPAGLINIALDIEKGLATGFGGFKVHRSFLRMRDLTFDLDISVPNLLITADRYKLLGDLFTAIPLYGDGEAKFVVENFRFRAMLYLKQSDDGKSILIDRIENASFDLPSLKAELTGVIGGGDIDAIANAIINEVIVDYVNRFNGAITKAATMAVIRFGNPILDKLDTWRYISRWA